MQTKDTISTKDKREDEKNRNALNIISKSNQFKNQPKQNCRGGASFSLPLSLPSSLLTVGRRVTSPGELTPVAIVPLDELRIDSHPFRLSRKGGREGG